MNKAVGLFLMGLLGSGCDVRSRSASPDTRAPVLVSPTQAWAKKQKMLGFLEAITDVQHGVVTRDWAHATEASSRLIPDQAHDCERPPQDPYFAMAHVFRCQARGLDRAVRQHDVDATLRAATDVLQTCNACHRAYHFEVVGTP